MKDKKKVIEAIEYIWKFEDAMGAPLGDRLTYIEDRTKLESNAILDLVLEIYNDGSHSDFFDRYGSYMDMFNNERYNKWQEYLKNKK